MVKNPPVDSGDSGLIPGSGRSPGKGNGNPLQYSCQGNPEDRETWWVTGCIESQEELDTTWQLNNNIYQEGLILNLSEVPNGFLGGLNTLTQLCILNVATV